MKFPRRALLQFLGAVVVVVRLNGAEAPAEKIRAMLRTLNENGQFNGSILVAREGAVVYRDAFGAAKGKMNRPETPSELASVTKQFTAMAVMILAEEGKLRYDDAMVDHLPQLREVGPKITVRHLLTHTSGIPDVGDLGIDHPGLKEAEVIGAIRKQSGQFAEAGEEYRYSNAGYSLLGMIVEKVSGSSLDQYLRRRIFDPLGMKETRVDARRNNTKGDSGIISTVDDLLKWDQALYTERLVKQSMLKEAFTPARVRKGTCTYGFGWNSGEKDGEQFVWHTGNNGEQKAFIGRRLGERILVVILTNAGPSRRPEICEAIIDILHDRPYAMPKLSIGMKIAAAMAGNGVEAGIEEYERMKGTERERFNFGDESELNALGYRLLGEGKKDEAVRIFELNVKEFSKSSNAHDSLGEACLKIGDRKRAIEAYEKAVELDANNLNARKALEKLRQAFGQDIFYYKSTESEAGPECQQKRADRRRAPRHKRSPTVIGCNGAFN